MFLTLQLWLSINRFRAPIYIEAKSELSQILLAIGRLESGYPFLNAPVSK